MNRGDGEESAHFLPHAENDQPLCKCRGQRTLFIHTGFLILHLLLTAVVLLVYPWSSGIHMNTLSTVHPLCLCLCSCSLTCHVAFNSERLELRQQKFLLSEESPYAGPPGEAIDRAWTELLQHVNIRASDRELASLNQTSVGLPGSLGGSLVWMDVSHQLHCVVCGCLPPPPPLHLPPSATLCIANSLKKYLRQWIYRDHYHPEVGPDHTPHWLLHVGMYLSTNWSTRPRQPN